MGAKSHTWGDLILRYASVFRAAWQTRSALEPPSRRALEREFLPAALELQETPVSALPRATIWTLVGAFSVAVLWAIFGRLDTVAVAHGKVIANTRAKVIQPLETAVIRRIYVRDGEAVAQGQVLVDLDATISGADSAQAREALAAAYLEAARSRALIEAIRSGRLAGLPSIPDVGGERMASEEHLLRSQFEEHQSRMSAFDAEIAKRNAERASTAQLVRKLEETSPIARQRADDYKNLMNQNFISKHGYLEREQTRIEQEGDLGFQRARLLELGSAVSQAQRQRAAYAAEFQRSQANTLNEAQKRIASFSQEQVKAEQKDRLKHLIAPVDGTVQQLAVHTEGGVATEAQPLMVIVPKDYTAEVEVLLENKDVGFVKAGLSAEIKFETFPFTRYGTIPGKVTFVSNDAVSDEKRGLIFPVRVLLDRATIQVDERTVSLSPGMAVTAEIKTGSRRVIEFFLSPISQTAQESLRER